MLADPHLRIPADVRRQLVALEQFVRPTTASVRVSYNFSCARRVICFTEPAPALQTAESETDSALQKLDKHMRGML